MSAKIDGFAGDADETVRVKNVGLMNSVRVLHETDGSVRALTALSKHPILYLTLEIVEKQSMSHNGSVGFAPT